MRRTLLRVAVWLCGALVWASCEAPPAQKPSDDRNNEAPGSDEDVSVRFPSPDEDAGEPPVDADCDGLGWDDEPARALVVTPPVAQAGRVCALEEDWLALSLQPGDEVEATARFSHAQGDLDLAVYDEALRLVAVSNSADDDESLIWVADRKGLWFLQIFGYQGEANGYEVEVSLLVQGEARCEEDALWPNGSPLEAVAVEAGASLSARLCPGQEDWFSVWLEAGASVAFVGAPPGASVALLDPAGRVVAASAGSLRYRAASSGVHALQIKGEGAGAEDYTLRVEGAPVPEGSVSVEGAVTFDRPWFNQATQGIAFVRSPLAGAPVELIDEGSGAVVAAGQSDGQGRYRLWAPPSASARYVRVLARRDGPEGDVDVVTEAGRVYAIRERAAVAGDASRRGDLAVGGEARLSAPFHVQAVASQGLEWWRQRVAPARSPLQIVWSEGRRVDCGTCYRHNLRTMYLLGLEGDNDALDEGVILHELGHYLQNLFSSDDSPGGAHDGSPVDPRLAWAEGWATGFALMSRDDARYVDTRGDTGAISLDLESPEDEYARFSGGAASGPISEYLVAALLWDLYDQGGEDPVAAGEAVLEPLPGWLGEGQRAVRGAEGVDLVDYLDGARCLEVAPAAALESVTEAFGFPYAGLGAPSCKPEAPAASRREGALLRVTPQVKVDLIEALACRGRRCEVVGAAGAAGPGQEATLALDVGRLEGARLSVRLRRGRWQWAQAVADGVDIESDGLQWVAGPAARDGAAVVERRLE